ncbi:MAG: hypothetical protein QME42_10305 [bacterium]|nr:hypothetical protein [bacterium]
MPDYVKQKKKDNPLTPLIKGVRGLFLFVPNSIGFDLNVTTGIRGKKDVI